ncbi:MAG: GDSL family lipase, partial [Ruminococcaceae bacterium]|nr:GDSL family lipase [Oscillospiraceae bacterium]
MIFKNMDRIVFTGDSVTDAGCTKPVGEGLFDNLGHGYVREIENLLVACYPDLKLRITNTGVSGNTSKNLLDRFDDAVIKLNPDWVSICIGINDVWRQFDEPAIPEHAVTTKEYKQNVEAMILRIKNELSVKGIFLCSPYYMEPNKDDWMRAKMDEYTAICKELAEKYNLIFVDFQAMYNKYLGYRHSASIAWDRVHPNRMGAVMMAKEI